MTLTPQTIATIIAVILARYPAESIHVYGSYARGTAKADSDIDVCIKMPQGAKVLRHDKHLNKQLWTATGMEVNAVLCTIQNAWMEVEIYKQEKTID